MKYILFEKKCIFRFLQSNPVTPISRWIKGYLAKSYITLETVCRSTPLSRVPAHLIIQLLSIDNHRTVISRRD